MAFRDPEKRREYQRRYYRRHREERLAYAKQYNAERQDRYEAFRAFLEVAKSYPCRDCGQTLSPNRMHFDHVRGPYRFEIHGAWTYSLETLRAEIAKCELRCESCHGSRHGSGVTGPE